MRQFLCSALGMGILAAAVAVGQDAGRKEAPNPAPVPRAEPCYVVIAVDASETMESSDGAANAIRRTTGKGLTLRDEGQVTFLQLLPFLRSDLYVGITHFSDRVRYSLPSRDTGPLLSWGQTFLSESACRNLVKPVELQTLSRPDVAEALKWAVERIAAARRQYGPGPAKVILLSNGDPRDGARELERGRGSLLSAAKQLAEQSIQLYPVLMDEASLRSGATLSRLSRQERAVEGLMHSVALTTGGRAYRLAPDLGFADILMDVFDLGTPLRGDAVVSPYDWAMVVVGGPPASLSVQPLGGSGPHKLTLDETLEGTSGIRSSVISSAGQRATILRRPYTTDRVNQFWQGRWKLSAADEKSPAAVRLYRIPDYLLQLETKPGLPWWLNEQVQLRARLVERHRETTEAAVVPAAESGRGLSIRLKASSAEAQNLFVAEQGRWTVPGRVYETEPFIVRAPGLYKLTGELRHTIGDVNAPLLYFVSDLYVHPACVGLQIVNAATNEVLQEVPPTAAKFWINLQGGQDVYVRAAARGELKVEPLSGVIRLEASADGKERVGKPEPLPETQWTLRQEDGVLTTGPIRLAEQEERLTGSADVDVRTFAGIRHLRLPSFELTYTAAPLHVACAFGDPREALWVGELHRQPVTLSASPVFERLLNQALGLFPENLAGVHLRTTDARAGTMQVMGPDHRLLERPQPGGYAGRTVSATYFLESTVPLPPADKCEIDLSEVMPNLQGAVKTYAVVDPLAQGLFEWVVQQMGTTQRRGPVSETLFCGEPILFFAGWRPDQNVSAVRFEIPRPNGAESLFVDVPVTPGTNKTKVEQTVVGLTPGQMFPIFVHVTMQPAPARRPLDIKLKAGQFRAEDRRVVLEELAVGDGTLADLPAYLWEPVEVPVRATFQGYKPDDLAHNAAMEQFKKSCTVTVTSRGDAKSLTEAIEWRSMSAPEGPDKTCKLTGYVAYRPEVVGRAALELTVEAPAVRGAAGPSSQRAYAHILVKEPRFALVVNRLKPGGEELVFDSRNWIKGPGAVSPLATRLSTRLRIDIQNAEPAGAGPAQPWKTTVRVLRRPAANAEWVTAFTETGEVTPNQVLAREVQIAENGQYALEVVGQDAQSNRPTAYLLTPIIASIQPHEVAPTAAPPAWLTSRVRQWPFAYLVTLHQETVDLSRPQALAFQFQLPGQSGETWLDGATAPVGPQTAPARQLSVKSPRLLPASADLRNGVARFRLCAQGLEILRWECPNIRVVAPVLEDLVFSRATTGSALATTGGALALDGSADLWVRPRFRAAPELEGQWAPAETAVYLWRSSQDDSAGGPADVRVLERLQEQGESGSSRSGIKVQRMDAQGTAEAVKVLSRHTGRGFWGWPRRAASERYSLAASVIYRPPKTADSSSGAAESVPAVVEWSDIYPIHLDTSWAVPMCWWPVVAALLMAVVAMVLRVLVPSPSRLALDMRLEENVAVVEPVRLDNPVLVDLRETSLAQEMVLYARYLCGRWAAAGRDLVRQAGLRPDSPWAVLLGRCLEGLAAIVAPIWVLLRRSLYPRRWAWAAVIPRLRGNAALVRTGLLCVWTGLGARRGRVWSSQAGSLALPEEGQTQSINLDLPYRIDSVDRTMRVTVRVRRMVAEEIRTTVAN